MRWNDIVSVEVVQQWWVSVCHAGSKKSADKKDIHFGHNRPYGFPCEMCPRLLSVLCRRIMCCLSGSTLYVIVCLCHCYVCCWEKQKKQTNTHSGPLGLGRYPRYQQQHRPTEIKQMDTNIYIVNTQILGALPSSSSSSSRSSSTKM